MTTASGTTRRGGPGCIALASAVDAVRETCALQLGLVLQPLPARAAVSAVAPEAPAAPVWYRSGIDLAAPGGRWRLTLVSDAPSAHLLAQRLFDLDPEEEAGREELADALNELVNIAAGVFKRLHRGPSLRIAFPVFAEGWPGAEPAGGEDSVVLAAGPHAPLIHVLLVWQPRHDGGGLRP
ncbi:MAG: hypothetical protein Q7W56_09665 [Candidatus Latescibacteria bacterium]|nr:hypothetical protein [Candidatus Latescibacterota bacterium]